MGLVRCSDRLPRHPVLAGLHLALHRTTAQPRSPRQAGDTPTRQRAPAARIVAAGGRVLEPRPWLDTSARAVAARRGRRQLDAMSADRELLAHPRHDRGQGHGQVDRQPQHAAEHPAAAQRRRRPRSPAADHVGSGETLVGNEVALFLPKEGASPFEEESEVGKPTVRVDPPPEPTDES